MPGEDNLFKKPCAGPSSLISSCPTHLEQQGKQCLVPSRDKTGCIIFVLDREFSVFLAVQRLANPLFAWTLKRYSNLLVCPQIYVGCKNFRISSWMRHFALGPISFSFQVESFQQKTSSRNENEMNAGRQCTTLTRYRRRTIIKCAVSYHFGKTTLLMPFGRGFQ